MNCPRNKPPWWSAGTARGEIVTAAGEPLGRVDFPTSCEASAKNDLEQGLALLHHMNYVKAKPFFEAAAKADAECAIAYWGIAMTLFPDCSRLDNVPL